ncbi:hypothetical protein H257_06287 [Aphanomyces astaci]|uniref:Uncharacterized protein n=1 Tax=Aphanomyces astaci TaxID=112090 RepID=W4GN79_APHAT|nr:hypothetical protein H257_06287 [Aphanomyces astaci]ETV80821.1 hypothetical protein H257_06287 [Aphanomyces astaci]|eukprot:XP_009829768.1 hypothetical protein H257_06287 [Aphanomyces astaci]
MMRVDAAAVTQGIAIASFALLLPEAILGRPPTRSFRLQQLFFVLPQFASIVLVMMHSRLKWQHFRPQTKHNLFVVHIAILVFACIAMEQSGFRMGLRWCCTFRSSCPPTPLVQPARCTDAFSSIGRLVLVSMHFIGTVGCFVAQGALLTSNSLQTTLLTT